MKHHCQICGARTVRDDDGCLLCETCAAHSEEYDRNADLHDAGQLDWNTSLHDPWWRTWLNSAELYTTIRQHLPRVAAHRGQLLGGDVYDYDSRHSCHIEAWISDDAIVVAYPFAPGTTCMKPCEVTDFEIWIDNLYNSEPLPLGRIRILRDMATSSYGAKGPTATVSTPTIMWAQAGDWAALFRNWHFAGSPDLAGYLPAANP